MPCKYNRICPVCGKENLKYLPDHLRQVHDLKSSERLQFLRSAKYQGIKCYSEVEREETVEKRQAISSAHSNKDSAPLHQEKTSSQIQNTEFQMEKILKTREVKGKTMYLIKWKGWDRSNNTWMDYIPK